MKKDLIERYLADKLEEEEVKHLLDWVHKSKENRSYFARIKNLWVAAQSDNQNPDINLDEEYRKFQLRLNMNALEDKHFIKGELRKLQPRQTIKTLLRVAAVLIFLYSLAVSYFYYDRLSEITYSEITTRRGEKSFLKLADGTKIWINSETTLRYPSRLNTKEVEVFLDGEAYFDVAKNPDRKFIVNASDLNIAVLGTSFNVKSYGTDNIIETTLAEGKISITGELGSKRIKNPLILEPNQQATFVKNNREYILEGEPTPANQPRKTTYSTKNTELKQTNNPQIIHSEKIDATLYSAWKDGKMVFKSESFGDLALRLERWYDIKIEIRDPELKSIKFTGIFEKETIEQALHALSLSRPFKYVINQNEVAITKTNN